MRERRPAERVKNEVDKKFRKIGKLSKAKGSLKEGGRVRGDIEAMKRQIEALSEHVDNLTHRVIKIEEGLEKLEDELRRLSKS
ncbi:MAG: hypothetical protein QMC89_01960 [Candidatus Hodarchaeaceae archaeon]|nr:hypothetical protein [Candidatus Hodarchaeaceae archaeon]